jgi:hypothetical protein
MSFISTQMARHLGAAGRIQETEDRAVTIRPSSTALFCVDSADRYPTTTARHQGSVSPYSFQITRNQALLNGFFTRIALTEVVFPYYIPNVNKQTNSIKVIYNGGAEVLVTIAEGFYTPLELAGVLQTALIAVTSPATTVTYLPTGQFQIDVGVGDDILLFSPTTGPNDFSLFDLIGGTDDWFSAPAQIQTGECTRCRFTDFIDIVCSQLTYNQELKDGSSDPIVRDVLARIYIETENDQTVPVWNTVANDVTLTYDSNIPGTAPYTIYRQFKTPKQILWNNTQSLGNLKFEVYDSRGTLLSANSTVMPDFRCPDWRISLLVSEN